MERARERGHHAERAARQHLERHGLRFRAANVTARRGEIDLVMEDGDVLVFVEVRLRGDARWGSGLESVTAEKRRRLVRAARSYLQKTRQDRPCRFDVVALSGASTIEWVRDAFAAEPD